MADSDAPILFHRIWVEQCKAAQEIKEDFGTGKALGYLIGEKLLRFLKTADGRPEWEAEIPAFITEIKAIFQPWELQHYLENVRRVGALGHVCTDEEYARYREMDARDDPVAAAENILLLERAKELLLA